MENNNGKGSHRRPCLVSRKDFEENWDRIFQKDKDDKEIQCNKSNDDRGTPIENQAGDMDIISPPE